MAEISWIKLKTTMFDDEKIRLIQSVPESDAILVIWIRLLVLAGKTNDDGLIYIQRNMPYSEEMLATLFGKNVNTVRLALTTLENFNMIDLTTDGLIAVTNWEKHQNVEGLEQVRLKNAERNRKYRERKKLQLSPGYSSDVSVTSHDGTDIDKELDIDKENRSKKSSLEQDFDKLWKLYPKKTLKSDGLSAYKKAIAEGITNKDIQDGIINYKQELAANDWQKPMDGGRWFKKRRWEDTFKTENTGIQKYKTLQEAMEEG